MTTYVVTVNGEPFPINGEVLALVDSGASDAIARRLRTRRFEVGKIVETGTVWRVILAGKSEWYLIIEPYQCSGLPNGVTRVDRSDARVFKYENHRDLVQALRDRIGRFDHACPYARLLSDLGVEDSADDDSHDDAV